MSLISIIWVWLYFGWHCNRKGEQFGNLKTCQNGNLIPINQVKLYKYKRLQGFCYQGLPCKKIPFVKHYRLSDLSEKTISTNYLQSILSANKY